MVHGSWLKGTQPGPWGRRGVGWGGVGRGWEGFGIRYYARIKFSVSFFQDFKVSKLRSCKNWKCQIFRVSKFRLRIFKFPKLQKQNVKHMECVEHTSPNKSIFEIMRFTKIICLKWFGFFLVCFEVCLRKIKEPKSWHLQTIPQIPQMLLMSRKYYQ